MNDGRPGWLQSLLDFTPQLIFALLIVFVSFVAARFVRRKVFKLATKTSNSKSLAGLLATTARIVIIITGIVIALRVLKLEGAAASLLAGAGIAGIALGFAFQDSAANFIAGVILSAQQQFEVGDLVQVGDVFGTVNRIDLRLTEIQTLQGQTVYVPNQEVLSSPVTDYSKLGRRRVDLAIGISYGDDLDKVEQLTLNTLKNLPAAMKDQPIDMYYKEFGDSSINVTARFWVNFGRQTDWLQAQSNAIKAIKSAYDKAGISIPFPITTLDFDAKGGKKLKSQL